MLAHVAKAIADRPRPYEVMAGTVLRQQPAHGTSFPSSHTAVTVAVVIALVSFLIRPLADPGSQHLSGRRGHCMTCPRAGPRSEAEAAP